MDTEGVVNRRMFVVIAVVVVAIDIASAQHESIYSARIHEVSMTGLVYNENIKGLFCKWRWGRMAMRSTASRRVLSLVMAAVLTVSGLPLPALAEAAEEGLSATSVDNVTEDDLSSEGEGDEVALIPEADQEEIESVDASSSDNAADAADAQLPTDSIEVDGQEAGASAFEQAQTLDGVKVTVRADAGVFPEGARLSVERPTREQAEQAAEAVEEARNDDENVTSSYTFDIKVLDTEGSELQPAEGQRVTVSFTLEEVANENLDTRVYHVTEDEVTGKLAAESLDVSTEVTPETGEETTAVVETDGFSWYTLEFIYGERHYVLSNDSSVALADVLAFVGLAGVPTAVEVSNSELLSVSNEDGAWVVTATQAFGTEECVKVTIDGVKYTIVVTNYEGDIYTSYVGLDGKPRSQVAAYLTSSSTGQLTNRWYYVGSTKNYQETIVKNLTIPDSAASVVNIILGDGAVLNTQGITIADGKTLRIWTQSGYQEDGGLGQLKTSVYGIRVPVGSTLEINGGIIEAKSSITSQAGIGGDVNQSAGTITINKGDVTAQGGGNAAGIGGGKNGSGGNITIKGETQETGYRTVVKATGGADGAGIGGGDGPAT